MFHLKTGVHFKEVEVLVAVHDEFDRTGRGIANGLRQGDGLLAHCFAGGFVKERRRGLLHDLLVAALDRTFAFAQIDTIAVGVAQHLNFDVARLGDEFLDKDTIIAKAIGGLVLGRLEPLAGLFVVPRDTHPLAAATGRGLQHHRIADFVRDLHRLVRVFDQPHVAGDRGNTGLLRDFLGGDLVAHLLDRALRGADKGDASGLERFGEFRVLGQEAIARVYGLRARLLDRVHDLVDHDIRLVRGGRADVDRLIGHLDVQRLRISVGIDGDGFDAHLLGGLDNAAGNLAAVGDQDLIEHRLSLLVLSERKNPASARG